MGGEGGLWDLRERGTVDTDPMIVPGGLFMGLRKSDREEVQL